MEWTRSETLALAANGCAYCHGIGLRVGRSGKLRPCLCALRAIFRACYGRFRQILTKEKYVTQVTLEPVPGRDYKQCYSRKDEEYVADFTLVTRRCLTDEEYRIFKFHYLLGADWKMCCRRLGMEKGRFFHAIYRIEAKLGRCYRELEPYALFPLDEYFHGGWKSAPAQIPPSNVVPIRGKLSFPAIRPRKAA